MKTFKIYTLGCKVNQYESQALAEQLLSQGLIRARGPADLYVINTCTVTRKADTKCRDAVKKARKQNPRAFIAAIGCLAQHNADFLKKCGVDLTVPQDEKHKLIDIIFKKDQAGKTDIWDLKINSFFYQRAFLKIQDGCDNFCSFCKIPYLRGKPSTRPRDQVLKEAERLSLKHKEIVLCGVNIGFYGKDDHRQGSFSSLVRDILDLPGLGRLRISSISPLHVDQDLINLFSHPKLCPHLHLPFQSGDDRILARMNKKCRTEIYEQVVSRARTLNPDLAVSCDLMVGFPGEDDLSFEITSAFLEKIRPMRMHLFSFSPREKTGFEGLVLKNVKQVKKRYLTLKSLALQWAEEYACRFKGKTLDLIAEQKKTGFVTGYTENYLPVRVPDQDISLGDLLKVKIDRVKKGKVYARKITLNGQGNEARIKIVDSL